MNFEFTMIYGPGYHDAAKAQKRQKKRYWIRGGNLGLAGMIAFGAIAVMNGKDLSELLLKGVVPIVVMLLFAALLIRLFRVTGEVVYQVEILEDDGGVRLEIKSSEKP